jgi:predicted amidophosphoribosyltransferase
MVLSEKTSQPALVPGHLDELRNVERTSRTCQTCAMPVRGFVRCWRCSEHQTISGLADIVAPLIYAVAGTESAAVLSAYKNHPMRAQRELAALVVGELLRSAIQLHEECFGSAVGMPISLRTVIPSLTYRPGMHPLTLVAESIGLAIDPVLVPGIEARCERRVRASKFAVADVALVTGRHVLVIDDVWTTGSNAQSAALTLRRAGAAAVSVLVMGRWLSPRNPLTDAFLRSHANAPFDPHVCPVTGGRCPLDSARRFP